MKRIFPVILFIVFVGTVSQAQDESGRSRTASRRAYPGGRDDTDLTVQSLHMLPKSKDSGEADHEGFEPVGPEYDASSSEAGFGE